MKLRLWVLTVNVAMSNTLLSRYHPWRDYTMSRLYSHDEQCWMVVGLIDPGPVMRENHRVFAEKN